MAKSALLQSDIKDVIGTAVRVTTTQKEHAPLVPQALSSLSINLTRTHRVVFFVLQGWNNSIGVKVNVIHVRLAIIARWVQFLVSTVRRDTIKTLLALLYVSSALLVSTKQ